tara:strand:+ start:35 stop:160 length:126 start_codon:yes stop_codon:yes gene_type:complete
VAQVVAQVAQQQVEDLALCLAHLKICLQVAQVAQVEWHHQV